MRSSTTENFACRVRSYRRSPRGNRQKRLANRMGLGWVTCNKTWRVDDDGIKAKPGRLKVREHRERLRAHALRPIQSWLSDVPSPPSANPGSSSVSCCCGQQPCPRGSGFHRRVRPGRMRRGEIWTVAGGED
ncbi:antitoxin MazE-like protein [Bradyrhizobium neotropicale]|uniref:antitoxin MazE-like protein n=1 Tax=Bradyrhizobium neotropicale TaxID=1497615 RepID=UPI00390810ED